MVTFFLFVSQRKTRLLLFLLECIVEQLLHKFLWRMFIPRFCFISIQRGSTCLSWLLEPPLSISRKLFFSFLFLFPLWVYRVVHRHSNVKMSAVVYTTPFVFNLLLSFFFLYLFSRISFIEFSCFTFHWLLFGNKIIWKKKQLLWFWVKKYLLFFE